jgi:hypothetical protein
MFTTGVELRALYIQKLHFKFTAVSADLLHLTWTYPEQTTDVATTPQLLVVAELSTSVLWSKVLTSSELSLSYHSQDSATVSTFGELGSPGK